MYFFILVFSDPIIFCYFLFLCTTFPVFYFLSFSSVCQSLHILYFFFSSAVFFLSPLIFFSYHLLFLSSFVSLFVFYFPSRLSCTFFFNCLLLHSPFHFRYLFIYLCFIIIAAIKLQHFLPRQIKCQGNNYLIGQNKVRKK